jgi:Na+/proline symporter
MAAKDVKTATRGPIIGGLSYLAFAAVPVFIVLAASIVMKEEGAVIVAEDTQKLLPRFVMSHMPQALQVLFFGALLSAIMSTASATVLAPATVLVQNVIKGLVPKMKDSTELILMRVAVFAVATTVLGYALAMEGTSIYELVASSYEATVVGAFVPLIAGLFWKRATNVGALCSVIGGLATWLFFLLSSTFMADPIGDKFPGVIAGLVVAIVGMIAGSLLGPAPDPEKVALIPD